MTYIWRAQERMNKIIVHVQAKDSIGQPIGGFAVCGAHVRFNCSTTARFTFDYPVCKNCLRSCVDKREIAA